MLSDHAARSRAQCDPRPAARDDDGRTRPSGALPEAFGERGGVFAAAYVAMQLVRTLLIVSESCGHNPARARNFIRISFYFVLSMPLWMTGALVEHNLRLLLWAMALTVEYAGPFFILPNAVSRAL